MTTIAFFAIAAGLLGLVIGIFALVVIGVRRGDRAADLASLPQTRPDALARRFLVGVRADDGDETERG